MYVAWYKVSCYHWGPTGKHCWDDSRTQKNPTEKHFVDILPSLNQPFTLTCSLVPLTPASAGLLFSALTSQHEYSSLVTYLTINCFSFDSAAVNTEFTPEETCWHSEVFYQMKTGKGVCKRLDEKQCLLWHFSCVSSSSVASDTFVPMLHASKHTNDSDV